MFLNVIVCMACVTLKKPYKQIFKIIFISQKYVVSSKYKLNVKVMSKQVK